MADVLVRTRNGVERTKSGEGSHHNNGTGGKATAKKRVGSSHGVEKPGGEKVVKKKGGKLKRQMSKDGTVASTVSGSSSVQQSSKHGTSTTGGKRRTSSKNGAATRLAGSDQGDATTTTTAKTKKVKPKKKLASRAKSFDGCSVSTAGTGIHGAAANTANSAIPKRAEGRRPPPPLRKQKSASALLSMDTKSDHGGRAPYSKFKHQNNLDQLQKSMPDLSFETPKQQIAHDLFGRRHENDNRTEEQQKQEMVAALSITNSGDSSKDQHQHHGSCNDNNNLTDSSDAHMTKSAPDTTIMTERKTRRVSSNKKKKDSRLRGRVKSKAHQHGDEDAVTITTAQTDPTNPYFHNKMPAAQAVAKMGASQPMLGSSSHNKNDNTSPKRGKRIVKKTRSRSRSQSRSNHHHNNNKQKKDQVKKASVRRGSDFSAESGSEDENDVGPPENNNNQSSFIKRSGSQSSLRGSSGHRKTTAKTAAKNSLLGGSSHHGDNDDATFAFEDTSLSASTPSRRWKKGGAMDPGPKAPQRERSTSNRGASYKRTTAPRNSLLGQDADDTEAEEDDDVDNNHDSYQPPWKTVSTLHASGTNNESSSVNYPDDSSSTDIAETLLKVTPANKKEEGSKRGGRTLAKKKEQPSKSGSAMLDSSEYDDNKRKSLCGLLPKGPKRSMTGASSVVSGTLPPLMDSSFSSVQSTGEESVSSFLSQKKPGLIVEAEVKDGAMKFFLGNLTSAMEKRMEASQSDHAQDDDDGNNNSSSGLRGKKGLHSSAQNSGLGSTLKKGNAGAFGGRADDEMSIPSLMSFRKREDASVPSVNSSQMKGQPDDASMPSLTSMPSLSSYRTQGTNATAESDNIPDDCSMPSLSSMPDDGKSVASIPAQRPLVKGKRGAKQGAAAVYGKRNEDNDSQSEEEDDDDDEQEEEACKEEPSEYEESMTEFDENEGEQTEGTAEGDDGEHEMVHAETEEEEGDSEEEEESDEEESASEEEEEPEVVQSAPKGGKSKKKGKRSSLKDQERQQPVSSSASVASASVQQFVVKSKKKKKKKEKNAKDEQVQQWQEEFQQEQLVQQQQLLWQHQQLMQQQQMLQQQYWMQNQGMAANGAFMMNQDPGMNYMEHMMGAPGQIMSTEGQMGDQSVRDSMGLSSHSDHQSVFSQKSTRSKKSPIKHSQSLDYDFSYMDNPEMPEVSEVSADDVLQPMNPSQRDEECHDSAAQPLRGKKKEKEKKVPALSFSSRFKKSVKKIKKGFVGGSKQKSTLLNTGLNDGQFFPDLDDDDDEETTMRGLLSG